MDTALGAHRFHFAFTITYHYLFPVLTMGLALLLVVWKTMALRGDPVAGAAAKFWGRIFGLNFAMGVVTGLPMEFQFGTNWAEFSRRAGGIVGQTLALEGTFSFFLESSFLGLFLYGERRLGPRGHWASAVLVCLGAWLSGFFIVATNAWMQHPVGHVVGPDGRFRIDSLAAVLTNPWLPAQYAHTMLGSVLTAGVVVAAAGAFYRLARRHAPDAGLWMRTGIAAALPAALLLAMPTGDHQARLVARHQPATFAAMEGLFRTMEGAPIVFIGQPDMEKLALDNPLELPQALSLLTWRRWNAEVKGLDAFPREDWPTSVPLLYYAYRVMIGLGTILIAALGAAGWMWWRGRLDRSRWTHWTLLLLLPFPYIANTAGWFTAELGRQPWLVYGLMRTADGASANVSAGNVLFTLIGFMGTYTVLSLLFLFLLQRAFARGPAKA